LVGWQQEMQLQEQQQIPYGDDNKKCNSKSSSNAKAKATADSCGMTTRKAKVREVNVELGKSSTIWAWDHD
jgi:hypothetical protein